MTANNRVTIRVWGDSVRVEFINLATHGELRNRMLSDQMQKDHHTKS